MIQDPLQNWDAVPASCQCQRRVADPAVVDLRIETEQRSAVTAVPIRRQFLEAKRLAKNATIVIYAVFRQEFEDVLGVAGVVLMTGVIDDYFQAVFGWLFGQSHSIIVCGKQRVLALLTSRKKSGTCVPVHVPVRCCGGGHHAPASGRTEQSFSHGVSAKGLSHGK